MRQDLRQEWKESDLQLAVLQVLLGARKINPREGGATGKQLMLALKIEDERQMQFVVEYLFEKGLVSKSERIFQITANGVDYVDEHSPDCTPPNFFTELDEKPQSPPGHGPPPWSPNDGPGPWPPRPNPDDPSKVPRKGKPSAGAGEIALPLPDPEQLNESQT